MIHSRIIKTIPIGNIIRSSLLFVMPCALLLLLATAPSSVNGQTNKEISELITGRYKNEVLDILFRPDNKIMCYDLVEADVEDSDAAIDLYWMRGNDGKQLSDTERKILFDKLLYNPINYSRGMVFMSSPYVPEVEFQLTHKGESISVLISPSDQTWVILYKGIRVFCNRYDNGLGIDEFISKVSPAKKVASVNP